MPPLLVRHVRRLVHARIVSDSGRWSDLLAHTVEVYVWAQLVGDGEAREAFQRSPAQGQFAVFWQPPRALAHTTGLVLRVHAGAPPCQWRRARAPVCGGVRRTGSLLGQRGSSHLQTNLRCCVTCEMELAHAGIQSIEAIATAQIR